jgi:hypothetical protein
VDRVHGGVVLLDHFVFGIGQQLEVQAFLGTELFVGVGGVHADADHDRIALRILGLVTLKVVGLNGASRRHVLGIEVQHHPLSAEI